MAGEEKQGGCGNSRGEHATSAAGEASLGRQTVLCVDGEGNGAGECDDGDGAVW